MGIEERGLKEMRSNKAYPDIYITGYAGSGKDTQADYLVREFGYKRIALADSLKILVWRFLYTDGYDNVRSDKEIIEAVNNEKKLLRGILIGVGDGARNPLMSWVGNTLIPLHVRIALFRRWIGSFGLAVANKESFSNNFCINMDRGLNFGNKNYWLEKFREKYTRHCEHGALSGKFSKVVVTDCRYPNEAQFFINIGFKGVRLEVPVEEIKRRLYDTYRTTDFSFLEHETEIHAHTLPVDFIVDGEKNKDNISMKIAEYVSGKFKNEG